MLYCKHGLRMGTDDCVLAATADELANELVTARANENDALDLARSSMEREKALREEVENLRSLLLDRDKLIQRLEEGK